MQDFPAWQRDHTLGARDITLRSRQIGAEVMPREAPGLAAKRFLDVSISLILILLFLTVLAIIASAIWFESGAPILFRQHRGGWKGKPFMVLKFRTMRVLEDGAGVAQATRDDPRVTRVGRFLRRTSLDELPQLWNVVRGHMSLVGPRPHALAHDQHYTRLISRYPLRHRMKPGITGLAQVGGLRGETATLESMAARVEADIRYIDHWTFWSDIRILVATARVVFFDRSAY